MRIRIARVEYKVCPKCKKCPVCGRGYFTDDRCPYEGCRKRFDRFDEQAQMKSRLTYEGNKCPACRAPFVPGQVRTVIEDRLIVVAADDPPYSRAERCHCPRCGNYYALGAEQLYRHNTCQGCGQPLVPPQRVGELIRREEFTLLKVAQLIARKRTGAVHEACGQPLAPVCWCPSCVAAGAVTRLPLREAIVWVRNCDRFHETVDEIKRREWLEADPDRPWSQDLLEQADVEDGDSSAERDDESADENHEDEA